MGETSTTYVTQAAWLQPTGRADLVDEIADQFERPAPAVVVEAPVGTVHRPRGVRGWRWTHRYRPLPAEHRAAG